MSKIVIKNLEKSFGDNKVDFPQPEGPTKTINSPSCMSMLKLLITLFSPNDFSRFLITIFDIYLI